MEFGLSPWQLAVVTFLVTLCVTPFIFDSVVLIDLHRNAWMALVPALGVGLAGMGLALSLTARFPGCSLVDYVPRVLGPWLGRSYLGLLALLLLAGVPLNLHFLTAVAALTELPHTPHLAIAAVMAGVLVYSCYFGPEVFARIGEVLAPAIALGVVAIFFAPLTTAVPVRLLPLGGFTWSQFTAVAASASWGSARGFLAVLVLGGMVGRAPGIASRAVLAVLMAWLLLELSLALPVAVLGSGFSEHLRFPILTVTGTVSLRWLPFQRLTTVLVLVWQGVMYVVLGFYLWSGVYLLAAACGTARWRLWLIPAGVLAAALAGMSVPQGLARAVVDGWNFGVIGVGLGASAVLRLAAGRRHPARTPA